MGTDLIESTSVMRHLRIGSPKAGLKPLKLQGLKFIDRSLFYGIEDKALG